MSNNNSSSRSLSMIILVLLVLLTIYNSNGGVVQSTIIRANHNNNQNNNQNNNNKNNEYRTQLHDKSTVTPSTIATRIVKNNNNNNNNNVNNINDNNNPIPNNGSNVRTDICLPCVDFFNSYLPTIIKIVTDYGVIESCSKICGYLNSTVEADVCTGLCDLVGVNEFWKIFLLDDINPIYACQMVTACVTPKSPAANFDSVTMTPTVGVPGDTFTISLNFTVVNATGVGQFSYIVYYVATQSKYMYSLTFDSYPPGSYNQNFTFSTKNNATFPLGDYPVALMMCSAECGTHTPYSVPLNETQVVFTLETIPINKTNIASFQSQSVISAEEDTPKKKNHVVELPLPSFK
ncbi:countin-like protein [Cavenderia fasciculata]|uniref:Countin-like protein n=1 Tax=Cavenderia fasciculata TaxID=261658 RepID=F4PSW3_CACFS|nr:countin-like protein [Cavenderia fasciculata]EGG20752.1 countin-like protein [Cavenderia fasciculata]|eukprot:XP_004358602.1 countin-like protein [Cavenderia fasciculata]